MLLKHLNIGHLVLLNSFLHLIFSQVFNTGIISLTPNFSSSVYTITNISYHKDVIIAISSFTSIQKSTVCTIVNREESSINFTCTDNIQSAAYLFYQKTPLVYSNVFEYYFLPNDQRASVTWYPPTNLTIIQYPTLRAMLAGFTLQDTSIAQIQLQTTSNNTAIMISRTTNVKKISFSFLMIQNYASYNLSFVQMPFNQYKNMVYQSHMKDVLNFWGISSLKFQKIIPSDQLSFTAANRGLSTDSFLLFYSSQNILIEGIFLISNQNRSKPACSKFYNPVLRQCQNNCSTSNIMRWNTSQYIFSYCLNLLQRQSTIMNYTNITYVNNNSNQLQAIYSEQSGCSQPFFTRNSDIICLSCTGDFIDYKGQCVCKYGFVKELSSCRKCLENECQLKHQTSHIVQDVDLTKVNILVSITLDIHETQEDNPKNYKQNLTINGQFQQVDVIFNSSSRSLNFNIHKISKQNKYQVIFSDFNFQNQDSFFYVKKNLTNQTQEYLWSFSHNITIKPNLSSQTILKTTISTLVKHSDKTLPFIFAIGFLIGDKINLMSFFQTCSIIYLTKFIEMQKQYDVLKDLIGKLFVFHPKAFFNLVNIHRVFQGFRFQHEVEYSRLIHKQTQGSMLLKDGINSFLSLFLQIAGTSFIFYLSKKLLQQSPNRVSPTQIQNKSNVRVQIIKKSFNNQEENLKSPQQPYTTKKDIRTRLFNSIVYLDKEKYIHFTSLILTQNLYFTLLSLYEMILPLFNLQAIVSRIFVSIIFLVILAYPVFLINQDPLQLLKSISILKKRYPYNRSQIWFYFYLFYNQSTIFGILMVLVDNSILKVSIIICFQLCKLVYFRKMLKNLEILKTLAILLFFMSILMDLTLSIHYSGLLTQITVITILLVVLCQILKLIRGLIVLTLNFLKGQQKQEKSNQKYKITNKKQINPILTHFQQRYRNQQIINSHPRTSLRKRKQKQDQNKQNLDNKDQTKRELALKRLNQLLLKKRAVLKLKN